MKFRQFLTEAEGIIVYHGSTQDGLTHIRAGEPPYAGGIGFGVYVGLEIETAQFYGEYVYELRTKFGWDQILGIGGDSENYEPIEEYGYNSIMTGEMILPFSFMVGDKKYSVVEGSGWPNEDEWTEYPNLGEFISMEDIGNVVSEAGYKAVYVVGIRSYTSVNEEMLVFDENDLDFMRQVQ